MKECPKCDRTYDDPTFSFCLVDGSVLTAPYDPEETLISQRPALDIDARIEAFIEEVYEHLDASQNLDDAAKKTKLEEMNREFYDLVTPYQPARNNA